MQYLDLSAFSQTPVEREPYDYLIVPQFIRPELFEQVSQDFPQVPGPGSHPPAELEIKGAFAAMMQELQGPAFRQIVENKFGIDLSSNPTMYTVRGFVSDKDGGIHTDSRTKVVTVLLYMNQGWEAEGGRLRILRSGTDLEDYAAEVSPNAGTLLVFLRSDKSWHGHHSHSGSRRAIQLNWVTHQDVVTKEQARHRVSTKLKKIKSFLRNLVPGAKKA